MALTMPQFEERKRLTDHYRDILARDADLRQGRRDIVVVGNAPEPRWVVYEREQLHQAVNDRRAAAGKPPVPLSAVMRVESGACGRSD